MTYALCCGGDCGISDVDNDMICMTKTNAPIVRH